MKKLKKVLDIYKKVWYNAQYQEGKGDLIDNKKGKNMTAEKNKNEFNELLEDLKCVVQECLDDEWYVACRDYDFDSSEEYEAYGDTYVSSGSYITESSEEAFRQDFKMSNDPDELIKKLMVYPGFRETLKDLVKEYSKTKELDV